MIQRYTKSSFISHSKISKKNVNSRNLYFDYNISVTCLRNRIPLRFDSSLVYGLYANLCFLGTWVEWKIQLLTNLIFNFIQNFSKEKIIAGSSNGYMDL